MSATIRIEPAVRDRLRAYGRADMTESDVIEWLMDQVDRGAFIDEVRGEVAEGTDWVDLEDA